MADHATMQNRDLKNEMVILSGLSSLSIIVGVFLLIQSRFEFWLTKPIGIFCLLFPVIAILYYLRLQFQIESEKSRFLDRILAVNPATILLHDWKTKNTFVLNGKIPTLEYSEEELYLIHNNLFVTLCDKLDLPMVMSDLQKASMLTEEQVSQSEWKLQTSHGEARPFDVRLTRLNYQDDNIFILAFIEDIYDRKNMTSIIEKNRERMSEMEKFSILRNLGSGVAHEIANPLAAIKGRTQLLKTRINQGKAEQEQVIEGLSKIENAADRINNTIHALRQLTRDNSKEPFEKHSVASLLEDIERVWGQRLRVHGFEFEVSQSNHDLQVTCRKSQIETVLFNLISNSFDHLDSEENKWVKIEVNDSADDVVIRVTDSGSGIPPTIREKIFNPFYSTRPDKSTGLGLSIAKGILQSHGGSIELDIKNPNTSFVIHIPKKEAASKKEAA